MCHLIIESISTMTDVIFDGVNLVYTYGGPEEDAAELANWLDSVTSTSKVVE